MYYELLLPSGLTKDEVNESYGRYIISPLERGYGVTLGNALRRVLLSSMEGAAIVGARFEGVLHEFSTLPGVYEEITEIILNLKKIRIKFDNPELKSATIRIFAEGQREIKAGDLQVPADVTVVNKDVHIASLTSDDARLIGELYVMRGRGYVPSEDIPKEEFPLNTIIIDGIFSPITKVNYTVENVRVRARTDYEKLTIEIWTDGTIHPDNALRRASEILRDSFDTIFQAVTAEKFIEC
jgi:DNA-directed RNA polymerase subunit alpha